MTYETYATEDSMTRLTVTDVRDDFAEVVNRVAYGGERIVINRRGKEIAALVPVEDVAMLEALEDRVDIARARKALAEARAKGTVHWDDLKAELGL
jgi:prevent-host-death family protein